ncbi:hypothetical protein A2311_00420 [candidate division WOR-1 bacterium RIFOXYB2_FULL_48_7]|uniref:Uncharacterized protein n=1 Tax=candidate division WOR-1 bacterium RIFOXYB2_FULL_48_7 TaxID=1802583 RepID=A0A1F4TI43_UNCSA|nr:MAG: hypothetical protein A2311_00420 [candidate division WOR-1 bacterium RIFOXYB2_FULL_48_7]
MWQTLGTIAVASLGGSFFIHYLKNYLLEEKPGFNFDWDGVIERGLIAWLVIIGGSWLLLIPAIILVKFSLQLYRWQVFRRLLSIEEPAFIAQKIKIKEELAINLLVSPSWAILIGLIF